MSDTPNIGFTLIESGQAQKEVAVNGNSIILDVLLGGVIDRDLTAPPGGESEGDAYIVASPATAEWAGHEDEIAYFFGGVYLFLPESVAIGHPIYVQDEDEFLLWVPGSPGAYVIAFPELSASLVQGDGLDADAAGFRGIPQNSQSGNYTLVAADAGKHICHESGAGAGDTYTIPANASVAFEIGTAVTFINLDTESVSIAINSDTLYLAGDGSTGTRTLAQWGVATAIKVSATSWMISGSGLS